ncbi:DUF6155 family protein [Maribacter sp. 2-571]|uniref:DUF6155 family protein n=1 Tax=Maribacter sp. 2-571 TaxID=3417569 RepID=UPI003D3382A0
MSKRQLKKYLSEIPKEALEEQLLDLYQRFSVVKEYYDFVFNPKEDKMVQEAKAKISNEYFPLRRKRPKARRSVAQKFIKHFQKLGMDAPMVADLMLYNIEIAQTFASEKNVPDAFYKSMLNSFEEAVRYISINALLDAYRPRIEKIYVLTQTGAWLLSEGFSRVYDGIDTDTKANNDFLNEI